MIGAGVAGLAMARALVEQGYPRVRVLERRSRGAPPAQPALGIWPEAWRCIIQLLGQDAAATLPAHAAPPAAYRGRDGRVLSACGSGMAQFVHTVRTRDLCDALLASAPDQSIRVDYDVDPRDAPADTAVAFRVDATGGSVADDSFRAQTRVHTAIGGIIDDETDVLSGGELEWWRRINRFPYETLTASGLRFALVPLAPPSLFWFATLPPGQELPQQIPVHVATCLETVARASQNPVDGALARYLADKIKHQDSASVSSESPLYTVQRFEAGSTRALLQGQNPWSLTSQSPAAAGHCCFRIGDAAFKSAHNLAQGASLAIEDAWVLAHALAPPAPGAPIDFVRAARAWEVERLPRRVSHQVFTQMTQLLGSQVGVTSAVRDAALMATPDPINSWVFDACLHASLGPDVGKMLLRATRRSM